MTVRELAQFLSAFHDQDADVEVVVHSDSGRSPCGHTYTTTLDIEKHVEYTDLRGNPFVEKGAPHENKRWLCLGSLND